MGLVDKKGEDCLLVVPKRIEVTSPEDEALSWLNRCAISDLRNTDVLNDFNHSLVEEGFTCWAKYVGGLRYLLECDSKEEMLHMLATGKEKLNRWFSWVCSWEVGKEHSHPGRLVWLSLEGLPLHAWTKYTFLKIA